MALQQTSSAAAFYVNGVACVSAVGPGCVKTQNRSLEIVSKLGEFSVEVSCLLTGRYRLVSQSIASHVVFEGDFWGETVVEF